MEDKLSKALGIIKDSRAYIEHIAFSNQHDLLAKGYMLKELERGLSKAQELLEEAIKEREVIGA